jgi:hypothetical protein
MKIAYVVFGDKECDVREYIGSSMSESKEWITPIGQNGGRSKMKRESEPAAMRKRFNEWKGCNDKLTAKLKKECRETRDRRLQYYRIA